ncbi:hypothetical protein PIIN_07566 [Serendipita indica DSM 11827]|uniref:BTB domain-containing protein n=1 Tax=Serendipita indica (strain DSM 11827) TaxID=1109443 RepID=G4TQM0_SERID|nr:hypothetical protein PIIN_07566 [Serendipita indica DSM 11827]
MSSFYFPDGDLVIKASDNILLRVHKAKMATASAVFADMFSFPTPEKEKSDDTTHVDASVELTESSSTLDDLLTFIYDDKSTSSVLLDKNTRFTSPMEDYERYSSLFEAACKYEVVRAQGAAVDALQSLLPHRALRAQIEDLATRLDHPGLAAQAKHYESIKLNKQLRAAAAWRTSSRKYMWQFWALCWVLAVVSIIKLAVSLHIHISLHHFIFPACETGVACPHQINVEFKLSVFTAFVSLFLAPVYCCFLVASQPVDRSILRFLIVVTWFLWVVDCIYSTLHLRASHGNCDRVSPNNPEFFADCLLRMASMTSVGLSYFCLLLATPQVISVGYWLSAVIYQQWLIVASLPRQTAPLHTLPELKPHSL